MNRHAKDEDDMILTKSKGMRMWGGGFWKGSGGSGGSGGVGGGGGSAAYADEAGHAASADEATHATSADTATNAGHATTADSATHATSADTATNAEHATTADSATHATSAADVDSDSPAYQRWLRKDVADTAAEVITFAKGLVSTLVSKFRKGLTIGASDQYGIDENGDATLRDIAGRNTTTENLNVTKEAHFFRLVVDELLSNKGAIIISSANCTAEVVVTSSSYYDVYFSATDRNGNAVINPWLVGDQAICLTFTGKNGSFTGSDIKNRYYWMLVKDVASNVTYEGATYHRVRLSRLSGEYDGDTTPEAGDDIVQLGYRGATAGNDYRKTAVILSAYPTMDTALTAPSLAFYSGINDFALASHRYTYMDGLSNAFVGEFAVLVNGNPQSVATLLVTMEGLLSQVQKQVGHNLLSTEAWTDGNGTVISTFEESTTEYTAAVEGSSVYTAFSPLIYLDAGTYCFSWYGSDPAAYYYGSATKPSKPYDVPSSGVVALTSQPQSGESYRQKIRQYATFSLEQGRYIYLHLFNSSSFSFCRPMLQKVTEFTDTPTAWDAGQQLFGSIIQQTAEMIRLQVGQCGLDLTNEAITAKGGKFRMQDAQGNETFVLDQNGNLVSIGDASFGGTVKATNFYHGVVIHGEEDSWLCTTADGGYGFVVGRYYTAAEVNEISDGDYSEPPTQGQTDLFVRCTGSADIVVVKTTANDTPPLYIVLPNAADYDGKIVEIVDTRYSPSPYYVGSLYVRQADGGNKMKGDFNETTPLDQLTLNGSYDHNGGSYRLLSYKQSGVSYWIKLKIS